jgi:phenylalanyl-tRNA synthetase beta chain
MRIPIGWLKDYVDVDETVEALAERLTLSGLEVEAVAGSAGSEVLEIALTPDLARCMSVVGVAREVAALTGRAPRLPAGPEEALKGGDGEELEIDIADPGRCHRFMGAVVRGVKIGESPAWMQQRLRDAGMQSIDSVVDVTNYVMLELGQPLHGYDYDVLAARAAAKGVPRPSIRVRPAVPGETITTLDGVERTLDGSELLIADPGGPLGVAGVMGGIDSGISAATRNVLLEAATFDGVAVRQAARQLKLHTEASSRFTRGVPATLNAVALRRAAGLLEQFAGGSVTAVVDRYPVPQAPRRVFLTAGEVRRQLGVALEPAAIRSCLERLEFSVESVAAGEAAGAGGEAALGLRVEPGEEVLRCTAPWYRLDVEVPADLTEEVARIVGYAAIPATRLADTLPPPYPNPLLETEERIRNVLVGCGLQEHINYTLTTIESHDKLGLPPRSPESYVTLGNPLSANRRVMRRSMLVSAVEALPYNLRYTDRVRCFEVGRVYLPEQGDGVRPREEHRLSVLLTGARRRASVHPDPGSGEPLDFFDLKGIFEALLSTFGWLGRVGFTPRPGEAPFGPRCAEVAAGGVRLGILGELHPEVAARWGLGGRRICAGELAIEPLVKTSWQREVMPPISNYPAVVEDLAFVVSGEVSAHDLAATIRRAGAPLLTALELFDLYRGEPLPPGSKSLAFQLTFQSQDATLGAAEVAAVRQRIEQAVAETLGGKLRA